MLIRVLPAGLLADVVRQVARGINRRVQQHRLAAPSFGNSRRIKPAQRRADHSHALESRVLRPVGNAVQDQCHGFARRRRQLRAPPADIRVALLHNRSHLFGFCRQRRRAKAVQVQKVGGGHAAMVNSLPPLPVRHARAAGVNLQEKSASSPRNTCVSSYAICSKYYSSELPESLFPTKAGR